MDLLYPSFFLKSDGRKGTPYLAPHICPISLSLSAFFKGLMVRVVVKKSKPPSFAALADASSRIEKQIRSVAPWVEKILCYEYPGILARPGSVAAYAGSEPARLYGELELLQNKS